jgi:hypothetical protein
MAGTSGLTDTELRGLVLKAFYDRRKSRNPVMPSSEWINHETTIDELGRICKQLGEHKLIAWTPFIGFGGIGEITAHGIDVVEGQVRVDIPIQLIRNYTANITGSTNVIVGDNNRQDLGTAFELLLHAVDSYQGSDAEKEESRGLINQLAKSPVFAQVVGQLMRFGLDHLA